MLGFSKPLLRRIVAIALVAMILTIVSPDARAAPNDSTAHGARLASPAVVRIVMSVNGRVICQNCANDGKTMTFPLDGGSYRQDFSGSGAIISPDGYVLTANHVVDWQSPGVQSAFYDKAVDEYARAAKISIEEATDLFDGLLKKNQFSIPTELISQRVFFATTYIGPLQNVSRLMSFGVERTVVSSPHDKFMYSAAPAMLKDDVAIVKIDAHDLPYLTLASASTIQVQDSVTAVAFPGDADLGDFTELLTPARSDINTLNDLLTPTIEPGQITAEKTFKNGTRYYGVSQIGYHGSSGGPVINPQGQIIGFVDLSSSTDRVIFLIPSSIIASYVKQASITNQEKGAFMSLWTKAINEYDTTGSCHWTQAYQDLKKLHDQYAQFGGIQPFLKNAQSRATAAECPTTTPASSTPGWLIPVVVGGVVLLLGGVVAFLILFVFLRRKKASSQPATTSTSVGALTVGMLMQGSMADPSKRADEIPASLSTGNALTHQQGEASTGYTPSAVYAGYPPPALHPTTRKCLVGHRVDIDGARFCPVCGAPVESGVSQEQPV